MSRAQRRHQLPPRDIYFPPPVAEVLGERRVAEMKAGPYPNGYRCRYCGVKDRVAAGTATVAGMTLYEGGSRPVVWFAHRRCGPGGVEERAEQPARDTEQAWGFVATTVTPLGLSWPFVLVEPAMQVDAHLGDPQTMFDGIQWVWRRRGMIPVSNLDTAPPLAEGWTVSRGGVFCRDHTILAPLPGIPPGWLRYVAQAGGVCGVYLATRTDLRHETEDMQSAALGTALAAALRDGHIIGVSAAVDMDSLR